MKDINFYGAEKILRLTPIKDQTLAIADNILDKTIQIFPTLESIRISSFEKVWQYNFPTASSTYSLYLYALYPVSYLLNAFELTSNSKYLQKALDLVLSFCEWETSEHIGISKKRGKILTGDHAISNRTQAMCYLVACLESANLSIPSIVIERLVYYSKFLSSHDKYVHYNHGLMMDLSLLGLILTAKGVGFSLDPSIEDALCARLNNSIDRDITLDGVHVENSPGYHFWFLNFLERVLPSIRHINQHLYHKSSDLVKRVQSYADYITKPDGSVPAIGDTHQGLRYKRATGLSSRHFKDSNQIVFRSQDNKIWAHFLCGYKTHVHKHCDNGSFTLFYDGHDILIDPGFINYEDGGYANQIKESSSHNTARPVNREQEVSRVSLHGCSVSFSKNLSASMILDFKSSEYIESAAAQICDYGKYVIYRQISWIKPNIFIIEDRIDPDEAHFEQFFQISPTLSFNTDRNFASLLTSQGRKVASLLTSGNAIEVHESICSDGFNKHKVTKKLRIQSTSQTLKAIICLHAETDPYVDNIDYLKKILDLHISYPNSSTANKALANLYH